MDQVGTVVVGAGVVGLAIAQELAGAGREVLVLEAAADFGSGISSRNSEVIHAGIYYEPGSLKARLCVEGRALLYEWCAQRGVDHRRCGKLIVATEAGQHVALARIEQRAKAAGVEDLRWLDAGEARALEPALRCDAALYSPSTGIVDSHGLMLSMLGAAEDHGATLALRSRLVGAERRPGGFRLTVEADGATMSLGCRELVNSAGLGAVALARAIDGLEAEHVPRAWMAKGSYFSLQGRCPFGRLVYPIPNEAGLGVHLTLDLAGQGRFGPDVEWVDEEGYDVDPRRCEGFEDEIRRYWPGLPDGALQPAYAGIRPKIAGPGEAARDFLISGEADHGLAGLINLFGIESPGLTSSLAIARRVRALLDAASGTRPTHRSDVSPR
jgi:L-2-hydroxyglutarate oxidase LhgO